MGQSGKVASRRGILAALGLGGAAVATVAVMPRQPAEAQLEAGPDAPAKPDRGGGYALTEHVKRYFKTTLV